jgi:hypothetical protein
MVVQRNQDNAQYNGLGADKGGAVLASLDSRFSHYAADRAALAERVIPCSPVRLGWLVLVFLK